MNFSFEKPAPSIEGQPITIGSRILCPDGKVREVMHFFKSSMAPSGWYIEAGKTPNIENNNKWEAKEYFGIMDLSNFRLP